MAISLNSFLDSRIYQTQTSTNPLYAAFVAGSTYYPPSFNGAGSATSIDPGGLFGWLIYARTIKASPAKGVSSDTYISYTNPTDFVYDLNLLASATGALIKDIASGGTYSFFLKDGNYLRGTTIGYDFLHALTYLAYGGTLVIAGTTGGCQEYSVNTGNNMDVLIGQTANQQLLKYILDYSPIVGIFASEGFTAPDYATFLGSQDLVSGKTVANRLFTVYGTATNGITTTSLAANTSITYKIPAISTIAGAFANSKQTQNYFLTVAGQDLSTPLNGTITNPVNWSNNSTKDLFKKNRVNFYSYVSNPFLALDLVGATPGSDATYISSERIGVANLENYIKKNVTNILLKYVFDVNNSTTRSSVTTEIQLYLDSISQYLDPNATQVVCDSSNNSDNSSTIVAEITVKPVQSISEISIPIIVSTDPVT